MEYITRLISIKEINVIKELWHELNKRHLELSKNFKEHYASQTFETRCGKFIKMSEDHIRIEAAFDSIADPIGYCICNTENIQGELDSLYVKPVFRKQGLGSALAWNGINWLREKGCRTIEVSVADGNEAVFPFYEKLGFAAKLTVLKLK